MPNVKMPGPEIAQRVATLARAKGMTQNELALASGLAQSTISKLYSGETQDPRISNLLHLCRALGCDLNTLLGLSPMPPTGDDVLVRLVRVETAMAQFLRGEIADAEAQAQAFEAGRTSVRPAPAKSARGRSGPHKSK